MMVTQAWRPGGDSLKSSDADFQAPPDRTHNLLRTAGDCTSSPPENPRNSTHFKLSFTLSPFFLPNHIPDSLSLFCELLSNCPP